MTTFHTYSASDAERLTIEHRTDEGSVTLSVHGEIDLASAPLLEQDLEDVERSSPRRIVLDLAALDFIDSTGIHLLIKAQRRADSNGHGLILTNIPPHARRLFRITGIDAQLERSRTQAG